MDNPIINDTTKVEIIMELTIKAVVKVSTIKIPYTNNSDFLIFKILNKVLETIITKLDHTYAKKRHKPQHLQQLCLNLFLSFHN